MFAPHRVTTLLAGAVANDLLDVITQTMEHASTSLWFRDQSK
ncbi:MAG TPA: hypothetical protein VHL52_11415 [Acidimicrobiia bacterium]|nr:hypothetical protein [Acidimicrobiia bacterium]